VTFHVKESENWRLLRFWRRTDCWCTFSWSIYDKNCHIIRCINSNSFWGYVSIYESWVDNNSEEEQWTKISIDRKRSSYTEKDCFEKLHSCCSTGDRTAELNIHLKTLFEQKLSVSLTNSTSMIGLQLLNLWLLKVVLRCVNNSVTTTKPGYQTTGSTHVIWSNESSFTLFLTSGRVYFWRTS
jgi:hypothetical protein